MKRRGQRNGLSTIIQRDFDENGRDDDKRWGIMSNAETIAMRGRAELAGRKRDGGRSPLLSTGSALRAYLSADAWLSCEQEVRKCYQILNPSRHRVEMDYPKPYVFCISLSSLHKHPQPKPKVSWLNLVTSKEPWLLIHHIFPGDLYSFCNSIQRLNADREKAHKRISESDCLAFCIR